MIVVEPFSRPAGQAGPMLLVHGGAWNIPDVECDAHLAGLGKAVETGKNALLAGNSALQTVAAVVASMEADGAFDAGRGAVLTRSGRVELDAGIGCEDLHHAPRFWILDACGESQRLITTSKYVAMIVANRIRV